MPSDRQREAARMLRIAHRDLKAARSMLDPDLFDEASWGFHVQQATEKSFESLDFGARRAVSAHP
jgi:hypothetical protein